MGANWLAACGRRPKVLAGALLELGDTRHGRRRGGGPASSRTRHAAASKARLTLLAVVGWREEGRREERGGGGEAGRLSPSAASAPAASRTPHHTRDFSRQTLSLSRGHRRPAPRTKSTLSRHVTASTGRPSPSALGSLHPPVSPSSTG